MKIVLIILGLLFFALAEVSAQLNATYFPTGYKPLTFIPVLSGNKFYYPATLGLSGTELVSADLSLSTASLTKDISPGQSGSFPKHIYPVNNKVVFTATDGLTGRELYVSDGTEAGTKRLTDIIVGAGDSFDDIDENGFCLGFNSFFLITSKDGKIYATDGTVAGTKIALPGQPNTVNKFMYSVSGKAFFLVNNMNMPDTLYSYNYQDNSKTFLAVLIDIQYLPNQGLNPLNANQLNGHYFIGLGSQIFVSDGTLAGSFITHLSDGEQFYYPSEFISMDGKIYFSASTSTYGREIHCLNLQTRTTSLVANINLKNNGAEGSYPTGLTTCNDTLFFLADDGFYGTELYKLKGSTFSRIEIVPGLGGISNGILDSVQGGILVSDLSSTSWKNFYKNGKVSIYKHLPLSYYLGDNIYKSFFSLPGQNFKFAVFRNTSPTSNDSLFVFLADGTVRYFEPNQQFKPSYTFAYPINTGSNTYFPSSSNDYSYLWRIDSDLLTVVDGLSQGHDGINLYPNPSSDQLTLSSNEFIQKVYVVDCFGLKIPIELSKDNKLNIKDLRPGIYWLTGNTSAGTFCRKFAKE